MSGHKIYQTPFARIYPMYVTKVERKGRSKAELDAVIHWLTGYDEAGLAEVLADERSMDAFFAKAPAMNSARALVTGVVCGVRVETVEDPLMKEIRILDKQVDELAKGRSLAKVLRQA